MNQDRENIKEEILQFVEKYVGYKVSLDDTLFHDLKLAGDDIDYLLISFSQKFDVSLDSLKYEKFFIPEMTFPFEYIIKKLFCKKCFDKEKVSLRHLVKVAEQGNWFDPEL